jgi:tripartite-type tricarboxylate transporter receptor subunit TctC
MGPPGLPREIVERWAAVFQQLARDPDWQQGNARLGGIAAIRSPAETERFVREQFELYNRLVGMLGIRQ